MDIYTIGHSTRTLEAFIEILKHYGIELLLDVRTIPRSRHVPWFNSNTLQAALKKEGIGYMHMEELGGLRKTVKDSVNGGWRNKSFKGYADYMQTEAFAQGIEKLIKFAQEKTVAIMCAEAVPWRCHRSLVGDALLVRGVSVVDIFDLKKSEQEKITSFAKVERQEITYPPYEDKQG